MKRLSALIIIALVLSIIFTGCFQKSTDKTNTATMDQLKERDEKITELEQRIKDLESDNNKLAANNLISMAIDVMELIKTKDMNALSQYVHPTAGVRFSPYFHIDTQADKMFTANQVAGLLQDNQVINWGSYDGSGNPIDLKFSDYYDKFIYDKDFVNPEIIGNNVAVGSGNTEDNVKGAYPNGHFIEFHFSRFDPQYEGIDWESLRLVFEEYNNKWYLVGIVHGQWTI